jgi:hypothetical protein
MQTTNHILLVKPAHFTFNKETAGSNAFQNVSTEKEEQIKQNVLREFENAVTTLKSKGVTVTVVEDTLLPVKPDAIFPNNWVSFHTDGTVVLYPMHAPNRRAERRLDVLEMLRKKFRIESVVDLSKYEENELFLEGTGSIVFDHQNKIAYACISPRTDRELFVELCNYLHYQPIYFIAADAKGKEIYHTNVMMCMAERFAVICLDSITNKNERAHVLQSLGKTNHEVIDITFEQMNHFAGNMLELRDNNGKHLLVMSKSAYDSLTSKQKMQIEKYAEAVPLTIKTIETIGGGSARCMIAEVFLPING